MKKPGYCCSAERCGCEGRGQGAPGERGGMREGMGEGLVAPGEDGWRS